MDLNIISKIVRIGSVITATLATFIISPPVINPGENEGLNWKNIFAFVAGILAILIYDAFKKKISRTGSFLFVGIFIVLLSGYEIFYYKASVSCFYQVRCVISYAEVKSNNKADFEGWKKNPDPDCSPVEALLQANHCSPLKVWDFEKLAFNYYAFIILYFTIIIFFILLVVSVSDKLINNEK